MGATLRLWTRRERVQRHLVTKKGDSRELIGAVFYVMGVAARRTAPDLANSGVGELLELLNVDGRNKARPPWVEHGPSDEAAQD